MKNAERPVDLPYLTSDLPGIGGQIKQSLEDFHVEEVPLYMPSGKGTHVYFRVEKAGVPTPVAVERIARYMGVRPSEIGVAGLKDARAVAVQMMSLEHADAKKLLAYRDAQVRVMDMDHHTLAVLERRGVPNYFGPQRFGLRGDTGVLGRAMVTGDLDQFMAIFLGRPAPDDPPHCRAARDAFDAEQFSRAMKLWPRHYSNERRALAAYKRKKSPQAAIRAIDKRMKRFYVSACQSEIFNEVARRRIDSIDRVLAGDLAQKTDTGGIFQVEDPEAEQPRADAFQISPTGPIVGYRASLGTGKPGCIEREVIQAFGLTQEDFRAVGAVKAKGTRRALRFKIEQVSMSPGQDGRGEFIELSFMAPSGSYATVALREIMK
jgi:tRNA pseudouridine13 synthase